MLAHLWYVDISPLLLLTTWLTLLVIIILIVVIIVVIYFKVINPPKRKRSLEDTLQVRDVLVEGLAWIPRGRSILRSTPLVPAALE